MTFLILIISTKHSAQNQKFSEQYAKASTATFYSSTVSNPFHELNYAIKLADSAKALLNPNSVTYVSDSIKIHSLINELNSSKLIAEDNLNYQIPGYSLIVNSRDDLNFIDISIVNDKLGKPSFVINEKIKKIVKKQFKISSFNFFLSISDEKKYSVAYVILQKKWK